MHSIKYYILVLLATIVCGGFINTSAQELTVDYQKIDDPFKGYDPPIDIGILQVTNGNGIETELYNMMRKDDNIIKKFRIYPYSTLEENKTLLGIKIFDISNAKVLKSLLNTFDIKFVVAGEALNKDEYFVKIIRTNDAAIVIEHTFKKSTNSTAIADLIKLLGQNLKAVYKLITSINIKITPTDALVNISGKTYDVQKEIVLEPGTYSINISKEGYSTIVDNVTLEQGNKIYKEYILKKSKGTLSLAVEPKDAEIFLKEGENVVNHWKGGISKLGIKPGKYNFEISYPGYIKKIKTIEIEENQNIFAEVSLDKEVIKEAFGTIDIKVNLANTVIILKENGEIKGKWLGELKEYVLKEGNYTFEFATAGYRTVTKTLQVISGRPNVYEVTIDKTTATVINKSQFPTLNEFGKITGRIIESETMNPLDGVSISTNPKTKKITIDAEGNFMIENVIPGTYQINASKRGYNDFQTKIEIQPGKVEFCLITLEKSSKNLMDSFSTNKPTFLVNNTIKNQELVLVKGGSFLMGSTTGGKDEKPVRTVTLSDFLISKYEVTFDEFDKFCNETGRKKPQDNGMGRGAHPVINIDWNEAVAFCDWLSKRDSKHYRLPTEAEWEFAARGGILSKGYLFSGSSYADDVANYFANSYNKTQEVGLRKPNELGLFDMSGNVYEWCSDWYSSDYYKDGENDNPKGPRTGEYKSIRGGAFCFDSSLCKITSRNKVKPSTKEIYIGFRVVREP